MRQHPKVSIIMATFNRAHFIVETLKSIQDQTYKYWECLIIDDGGTDNTVDVISPILIKDKRFKYYKRPQFHKKGLPGCRNYGIELAKGHFIIFFDDDDIVHPQNLEFCVSELKNTTFDFFRYKRSIFFKKFDYKFDSNTNYTKFEINVNDLNRMIDGQLPFNSCAVMWKKECFEEHKFVENLMYAEEWELYSRILSNGFKGISINKTLFYGRKHKNSNTGEFWEGNTTRVQSKKQAIFLVLQNLVNKQLVSPYLLKYLAGLAISFRDYNLLNDILNISKRDLKNRLYLKLKFYMFPVWKIYKKTLKNFK